jgi:deoxyribonuclease V
VWPTSPDELIEAQLALASARPDLWQPTSDTAPAIGACVVVFPRGLTGRGARGDPAWAAAAVLQDLESLDEARDREPVDEAGNRQVVDEALFRTTAAAPYVPGLLALREGPALESALRALSVAPDVALVDATGRDHPLRAGLALQLGAVTGLPTVGVTHRPLLAAGEWPGPERGATSPVRIDGEQVGVWLRTRADARPLAIHPAWRTSLEVAVDVVMMATRGHRTPEPLRHARWLARVARGARG